MAVKRVNITLPEDVIKILNKEVKSAEKSSYIAEAVRHFSRGQSRRSLMREMIKGYEATSKEDREQNSDWESTMNDGLDDKD